MTVIHHLNCCTMRPRSERFMHGEGSWLGSGFMVAHCLVIETSSGLVLVDSGIGTRDVERPERLGRFFLGFTRPVLDPRETAVHQLEQLGYRRRDVRHIVLTHLDVDHAGGISDFPDALIHVCRAEHAAAMSPSWKERERYRACHFEHGPRWILHDVSGDRFMGLEAARAVVDPDVLIIPTAGHSRGHAAVAVRAKRGWLLHCGDAYFHKNEVARPPSCPPGLRVFQTVVAMDNELRLKNQARIRDLALANKGELKVFCAHDRDELAAYLAN
jgi:glyoxylase-like metal-dependent hydrolase (beta-lactamase superfamily II)